MLKLGTHHAQSDQNLCAHVVAVCLHTAPRSRSAPVLLASPHLTLYRLELGGLGLAVAQRQGVDTVRELEVVRA